MPPGAADAASDRAEPADPPRDPGAAVQAMTNALWRRLTDRSGGPARAVLRLWPAATVPAFALNVAAVRLATAVGHPPLVAPLAEFGSRGLLLDLALVVAVAPVVETLLMGLLLALLRRLTGSMPAAAIVSGLLWGLMHSIAVPLWGVPTAWIFFVLSAAYLSWRERSFLHAVAVASAVHALNNATALALAAL